MKVSDLIKSLGKCNPDATVILTVGNEDHDIFSSSEFEVHNQGEDSAEYIELFMSDDSPQQV